MGKGERASGYFKWSSVRGRIIEVEHIITLGSSRERHIPRFKEKKLVRDWWEEEAEARPLGRGINPLYQIWSRCYDNINLHHEKFTHPLPPPASQPPHYHHLSLPPPYHIHISIILLSPPPLLQMHLRHQLYHYPPRRASPTPLRPRQQQEQRLRPTLSLGIPKLAPGPQTH